MKVVNDFAVLDLNDYMRRGFMFRVKRGKVKTKYNKYIDTFEIKKDFVYKGIKFKIGDFFQREY